MQLLEVMTQSNGKTRKIPTAQGKEIGIFTEERSGQYGVYTVVLFSPSAQQFVYDHLEAIVGSKQEKEAPLAEFHGRPWTEAHDQRLADLFQKDMSVSEMAFILKRTEGGVQSRLKQLGLMEGSERRSE